MKHSLAKTRDQIVTFKLSSKEKLSLYRYAYDADVDADVSKVIRRALKKAHPEIFKT
jgi:hypothetical protein